MVADSQGRAQMRTATRPLHDFGAIPANDPDNECCSAGAGASVSASATHVAGVWETFQTVKGQVASAFTTTVAGPIDGTMVTLRSCSPFSIPPPSSADVDGSRVAFTAQECNTTANDRVVVRDLATSSDVATIPHQQGSSCSMSGSRGASSPTRRARRTPWGISSSTT